MKTNNSSMANFKITSLTAFVATDPDNQDEGVIGINLQGQWFPLIGADEERIKSMYASAAEVCALAHRRFKVLRFSHMEDITEETKEKYGK